MMLGWKNNSVIAALLLLATGANAQAKLQVNLDSTDSIKKAAKTVAANLWNYYDGDKPGRTPGILPGPPPAGDYYWWQAGAMFGTLIDYWHYTRDDTYNNETVRSIIFQADPPRNAFMPSNWTASLGNDDQGFWGMAAMLAAEVNFPNPTGPNDPGYVALAQAVFNTQAERWDNKFCNGGLRWQVPHTNGGYNYKNTIANVVFLNIAARLARYTRNDTYAQWAERSWDWTEGVGYIKPDFNVVDGGHTEYNCSDTNQVQWSANAAVLIHGAAIMWNYTENPKWKTRTLGLLNRTIDHFFVDGIMVERPCELEDRVQCNVDQHSFKGYMHRALATVAVVAPFTRSTIVPVLKSSTKGAVSSCLGDGTCGFRWNTGSYDGDKSRGPAGQQMSVLAALSTLLLEQSHVNLGPLTNSTGGTSKGDAAAGIGEYEEAKALRKITTGDKVGAAFVTLVVLGSFLGSLVWLGVGWGEK
ncbi:family 76 putative glycoside hydrolase [Cladorrhinum sp. PSN259]|nr:family 76 putative glycoside hydrolase [Cladorrhinum sp. PSN259]